MLNKKSINRKDLFLGLLLNALVIIAFILLYRAYLVPDKTNICQPPFEEPTTNVTNPVE